MHDELSQATLLLVCLLLVLALDLCASDSCFVSTSLPSSHALSCPHQLSQSTVSASRLSAVKQSKDPCLTPLHLPATPLLHTRSPLSTLVNPLPRPTHTKIYSAPPPPATPATHTQLSESTVSAAKSAVKAATALWGGQALPLLEAEDRLSVACEKGDTQDEVLLQLRQAYQVPGLRVVEYV